MRNKEKKHPDKHTVFARILAGICAVLIAVSIIIFAFI